VEGNVYIIRKKGSEGASQILALTYNGQAVVNRWSVTVADNEPNASLIGDDPRQLILYTKLEGTQTKTYIIACGTVAYKKIMSMSGLDTSTIPAAVLKDDGTSVTQIGSYKFPHRPLLEYQEADDDINYTINGTAALSPNKTALVVPWRWSNLTQQMSQCGMACLLLTDNIPNMHSGWPTGFTPINQPGDLKDIGTNYESTPAIDSLNEGVYYRTAGGDTLKKRFLSTGIKDWEKSLPNLTAPETQPTLDKNNIIWIGTGAEANPTLIHSYYINGTQYSPPVSLTAMGIPDAGPVVGTGIAVGTGFDLFLVTQIPSQFGPIDQLWRVANGEVSGSVTLDSVEEFRSTTTNANADLGRSSGAQVTLVTIVKAYAIAATAGIVVGLPMHTDGREGVKALEARDYGQWLAGVTGLPVEFADERFTTVHAESALWNAGLTHRKRKDRRDRVAAQIMLQVFLNDASAKRP
jgi:putative transcription antitermination factor YqgF